MSNTCFTTYKVVSENKKDVTKLFKTIQRLEKRKTPILPNGWYPQNMWLGCLVKALKGDPEKVHCRGTITFYGMEDDVLTISTETAWNEMSETRHFIESCFPDMKIYYIEEECGCELFNTNDSEGLFFKDRYYLDGCDDSRYFETIEEAASYVKKIVGHDVKADFKAIEKVLKEYQENNEEAWYSFHEFDIVD